MFRSLLAHPRHRTAVVSVAVAAAFSGTGCSRSAAQTAGVKPIVLGYYPYWSTSLTPEQIPMGQFTHIVHAFALVGPDGKPLTQGNAPSKALTENAHKSGVKVLLGIGGGSNGPAFSKMVRDPEKMPAFVTAVVEMAQANGYDGIDIDWEYPEKGDEDRLITFVETLRRELRARNPEGLLFMAMSRGNYYGQWFQAEKLRTLIDCFQVMNYDAHGPWSKHAGFNAALYEAKTSDPADGHVYSYQKALDYWMGRGLSKDQLLVGFPIYGYGFAAKGWGQAPDGKSAYKEIAFKNVSGLLNNGWTRNWDAEAAVPWLKKNDADDLITYDDEVSTQLKGAWAQKAGVKGYFFWNIEQDYVGGRNILVDAARTGWDLGAAQADGKLEEMRKTGKLNP